MNLRNYYTEDQTSDMLSVSKATLRKYRDDLGAIRPGQSWFYNRRKVENFAYKNLSDDEIQNYENISGRIKAYEVSSSNPPDQYETYDISLNEYVPVRELYKYFPRSRQNLDYVVSSDKHRVHRQLVDGAWFYYKPHVKDYLLSVTAKTMEGEDYPFIHKEATVIHDSFESWKNSVEEW